MKVLKTFEFKTAAIGEKKYQWDELLDGQARQLEAGTDYHCKNQTFRMMAAKQAQKRGMRVKVNAVEGGAGDSGIPQRGSDHYPDAQPVPQSHVLWHLELLFPIPTLEPSKQRRLPTAIIMPAQPEGLRRRVAPLVRRFREERRSLPQRCRSMARTSQADSVFESTDQRVRDKPLQPRAEGYLLPPF
jgi:hypothetical protein